jgi:toxin-antitoxin system PIN domain toxin
VTTYLLDVNVLLALGDPLHIHHQPARRWFSDKASLSWATCPITENGFVRIASHPSYTNPPGDVPAVLVLLHELRSAPGHEFWPDDISLLEIMQPNAVMSPGRITDAYLLGLAAHRGGKLATLDTRIPVHAVHGGREAIEFVIE